MLKHSSDSGIGHFLSVKVAVLQDVLLITGDNLIVFSYDI